MSILPEGAKTQQEWMFVSGLILIIIGLWFFNSNKDLYSLITVFVGFFLIILSLFWTRIKHDTDKFLGFGFNIR